MSVARLILVLVVGAIAVALYSRDGERAKTTASGVHARPPEPTERDLQIDRAARIAKALRDSMHDPKSFELVRAIVMPDGAACYAFRARNGFGALRTGSAVFDGARLLTSDDRSGAYTKTYRRHCENKTGDDITAATKWYVL